MIGLLSPSDRLKNLKYIFKKWALDPSGWKFSNSTATYNLSALDDEKYKNSTFYKERWIKENGLEQKLIVTYSIKYRNYQRQIRSKPIERAQKTIENNPGKLKKCNQNDYKRFICKTHCTGDGEVAEKEILYINAELISQ